MSLDIKSLVEGQKYQCPECAKVGKDRSHNNLHYYGREGGGFCFSCKFTIPSEEYVSGKITKESVTILQSDVDSLANKALTEEQLNEIHKNTVDRIKVSYRGLDNNVCNELGVRWEINDKGLPTAMYYPTTVTEDGEERVVGYKVRKMPKTFHSIGYVSKMTGFMGQTSSVEDVLIITGGEIDLITAIGALKNSGKYRMSYNVVCAPNGESSTDLYIKLNYDWVDSHKKIVIALDDDEAGNATYERIKGIVDNSRLFRANMRHKDINDYVKHGDSDKLANDLYWNPIPTKDFGIAGSSSIYDSMVELARKEKVRLPAFLDDLNDLLAGGVGVAELILLVSPPSVGKSSIVNQWILDWLMNSPYKMFVVSIEDSKASFGIKIASKITSINIMGLETVDEKLKVLSDNKGVIDEYLYNEDGSDRFNILEKIPQEIAELKKAILQAITVHGCKIVVVDPLSALLASMSNEQQVDLMAFFEGLKRDYEIIAILCLHTRKSGSGQKDISEGADYGESDIRGSSSISGTGTITIMLSRDKYAEDEIERNTTNISVPKNRSASRTGRNVAKVYYSPEHSTLFSYEYAQTNNFFKDVTPDELKSVLDNTKATPVVGMIDDLDESMEVF